jgi:hypothetical protein
MTTIPRVITTAGIHLSSRFRNDAISVLVLLVLIVASWFHRLSSPIDLRFDGGAYYVLGTSLAEGKGYRLLNEPGKIEAVQYPPLLSLIVAVHQRVLGTSDPFIVGRWLKLSFFLIFILYIFATYWMLRGHLPVKYAFLATLICLLTLYTYLMSNMFAPEIPFGLATVLFFLCHSKKSRQIYSVLAVLFAMVAYALRTMGVALLGARVVESLLNREFKRAAIRLTLSLIPILCWQSYIHSVESGLEYNHPAYEYQRADYMFYNVSYARNIFRMKDSFRPELGYASFGDIAERFLHNLARMPTSLGEGISVEKKIWCLPLFGNYFGATVEKKVWGLPLFRSPPGSLGGLLTPP